MRRSLFPFDVLSFRNLALLAGVLVILTPSFSEAQMRGMYGHGFSTPSFPHGFEGISPSYPGGAPVMGPPEGQIPQTPHLPQEHVPQGPKVIQVPPSQEERIPLQAPHPTEPEPQMFIQPKWIQLPSSPQSMSHPIQPHFVAPEQKPLTTPRFPLSSEEPQVNLPRETFNPPSATWPMIPKLTPHPSFGEEGPTVPAPPPPSVGQPLPGGKYGAGFGEFPSFGGFGMPSLSREAVSPWVTGGAPAFRPSFGISSSTPLLAGSDAISGFQANIAPFPEPKSIVPGHLMSPLLMGAKPPRATHSNIGFKQDFGRTFEKDRHFFKHHHRRNFFENFVFFFDFYPSYAEIYYEQPYYEPSYTFEEPYSMEEPSPYAPYQEEREETAYAMPYGAPSPAEEENAVGLARLADEATDSFPRNDFVRTRPIF